MNQKTDIENYLIDLYEKTKNFNFDKFVEKIYHYNVKIGDYGKIIKYDLEKTVFDSINEYNSIRPEIKYWDSYNWSNVFILFDKYFKYFNKIVLDMPIFDMDLDKVLPVLTKYIIYNKVTAKISVHKIIKNPSFKIEVYSIDDANKIIDFFGNNNRISTIVKSRVIPFLIQKNLIGIYREYDPFSFKNFYIKNLYEYFLKCDDKNEVKISKFKEYISNIYRFEKKPNERRMYGFLCDYINAYDFLDRYESIFQSNYNMSLGGYNHKDYNFIVNEESEFGFVSKKDNNILITYGSEIFLNLVYSKFYDSFIKKEKSDKYFNDFSGIYDSILSSNFKNVDSLLKIVNESNKDMIYKKMYILSSGYFAYSKLNISIDIINNLMDRLLYILQSDREIEDKSIDFFENEYRLTYEYGNKIINLKSGKMTTIKDYFKKYDISKRIPKKSIIILKDGTKTSGKSFLDNIYKYISKYDNFDDLYKNVIEKIEEDKN